MKWKYAIVANWYVSLLSTDERVLIMPFLSIHFPRGKYLRDYLSFLGCALMNGWIWTADSNCCCGGHRSDWFCEHKVIEVMFLLHIPFKFCTYSNFSKGIRCITFERQNGFDPVHRVIMSTGYAAPWLCPSKTEALMESSDLQPLWNS